MPPFKPVIITTTFANRRQAKAVGQALLQAGLAACIQYETIRSQYVWNGEICCDDEIRMVIKTARCHYAAVEKTILQHHDYECPQILMQAISRGYRPYLRWLKQAVGL